MNATHIEINNSHDGDEEYDNMDNEHGRGIHVGKLSLCRALGGVRPSACLPITIDVGTNNKMLLDDEFYTGLKHNRATGQEYYDLLEEFMSAVKRNYGQKILIQAIFVGKRGNLMNLVDPRLGQNFNRDEAEKVIRLALLCTSPDPAVRPAMSQVDSDSETHSHIDSPSTSETQAPIALEIIEDRGLSFTSTRRAEIRVSFRVRVLSAPDCFELQFIFTYHWI
ncbi:NADP-malic enzyme 1 [Perilla frutescens var. frutescens]|nr:NADP-malic enzyme 1 [Perilla frutescens var. frutescens]